MLIGAVFDAQTITRIWDILFWQAWQRHIGNMLQKSSWYAVVDQRQDYLSIISGL